MGKFDQWCMFIFQSLQHYFYVASLSNRCFDLVDGINYKVSRGLLEGSREKELNQSYFNFLYGKTEEERYRYLCLLEKGEISPKNFTKVIQSLLFFICSFLYKNSPLLPLLPARPLSLSPTRPLALSPSIPLSLSPPRPF